MNDDFLHKIRVEPPPEFLARLKSRLDLQPPPATPEPAAAKLKKVLLGVLLTTSAFAVTLLVLNRSDPPAPPVIVSNSEHQEAQSAPPVPANPQPKVNVAPAPKAKSVTDKRPTTLSAPKFTYVTTKALGQLLGTQASGPLSPTLLAADSADDAVAEFCRTSPTTKRNTFAPVMMLLTRRMTRADWESCHRWQGAIGESDAGHQVIVLARSRLYGAFNLTPTELFLALAAEIPDSAHPGNLRANPNTMWSDINSSLEREPIAFFGPEPTAPLALAFREMLYDVGCRALPGLATAEKCPDFRTDGVYVVAAPTPPDMLLKLQTKPDAIGILAYSTSFLNMDELMFGPIRGVVPTRETIANETYPGSRPLYMYYERDSGDITSRYLPDVFNNTYRLEQFAIIPPERSHP